MAVEIPVYVDIKGAIDRAASEIPKEMPKLEKALSSAALKIDFGGENMRTLLTDASVSSSRLRRALSDVRREFEAVASGAQKARRGMNLDNLIKSYALLEQRLTGTFNQSTVSAMKTEVAIGKVEQKIIKLRATLSTAAPGTDLFNKTNYELQLQTKRIAELNAQLLRYKAGVSEVSTAFSKQSSIVRQLSGYFSGLYAAHTLLRFVRQIRDVTGELEYQRVALGHLLQDEEFGNELFAKTVEAAKESPFRIGQLVRYTKELAAYRIEQENLFDTTQRLADISAGLGVDMERLILAYGQVRAASVLRGQELRQFTEAGIPLVDLLAEKFRKLGREGTTTADVFKLISERAVPFEYIKEIFEDLTNAGGMFYKMQETQAKTLQGRWEKLKDAYDQALMGIGETGTFQKMNDQVLSILNGLAKNLNTAVRVLNAGSIAWAAYWIATKSGLSYGVRLTSMFIKEYGAVSTLTMGVAGLTAAFKKLWITLKSNWVGLAISAVAGAITYFTTFRDKTKEANQDLSDMQKAIEKLKQSNKDYAYGMNLIKEYEELSNSTEKTSSQSERLAIAVNELRRLYPSLEEKIGAANVPLSEQVELLENAAENTRKLTIEEAKNRLQTQARIIAGYEDELKTAEASKKAAEARQKNFESNAKIYEGRTKKQYEQFALDAAKQAKAAEDNYDEIAENLIRARKEMSELQKLAYPEDATEGIKEWQNLLISARQYVSEGVTKEIFTESDVKGWNTLGEAIKKLKPQFKEAKETYEGLVNAVKEGGSLVRPALVEERDSAKDAFDAWSALNTLLGGLLTKSTKEESYTQDPFIKQLQERMKFMKDFQKGYEDLKKYMSSAAAEEKESEIMLTRGLSLGIDPAEQKRAAQDLSKWYEDTYTAAFDYLKKSKGVTGTMQEFLSRQITGNTNRDKMLKDFQSLIQSLFDAKTDFDTSQITKNTEESLKRVTDEIKRSETARNFYQDILGLTGDEDLATTMTVSVYGDVGEDFKDRIKKQLVDSLNSLDAQSFAGLDDAVRNAFNEGDYDYLVKNLDKVPEKLRDVVKQVASDAEKYNADVAKSYAKLLLKYDEMEQQRVNLTSQANQEIKTIEEGLALELAAIAKKQISEEEKAKLESEARVRADAAKSGVIRERDLGLSRLTREYRMFFSSVGVISDEAARKVASRQKEMITEQFNAGQKTLAQYKRELREIDEQLKKYTSNKGLVASYLSSGIDGLVEKLDEYSDSLLAIAHDSFNAESGAWSISEDEKNYIDKLGKIFGGQIFGVSGRKNVFDKLLEKTGGNAAEMRESVEKASDSIKQMGSSFSEGVAWADLWVKNIGSLITELDELGNMGEETADWWNGIASVLTLGIAKFEDAGDKMSTLNQYALSGFEKFKQGDFVGAIADNIKGWASVFGPNIKAINKEIDEQSDYVEELKHSYERLGVAIDKAFGQDYIYNYNKQMEVLQAQAEAYRKQAELERSKGKKADEDTAKGYEKSAREIEDQMEDMRSQLSEFFAGTDVTSAATDFAQAWIEAYKQFGSTTDAMREKFQDMLQNMIQNSLAAKIMQSILQPLFDEIDEMAQSEDELSASEIAKIAADAPGYIDQINNAMTTLMSQLAASGYDVRQQMGQFTGISRNIAGASEESITGLAAGINTQNFYISHIDATVTAILSAMTGGSVVTNEGANGAVTNPYQTEMLMYAGHIPTIDQNLSELLSEVRKVIKPRGTAATHYVATNL